MVPTQPFSALAPTVTPARELPGSLKALLGFKVLSCLFSMGVSVIALLVFDNAAPPPGVSVEAIHAIARLAVMATGASMIELFGVAGTWAQKRWGVYILAGFSMLGFVLRMHSGDPLGAVLGIGSTLVTGFAIAARWKDFE